MTIRLYNTLTRRKEELVVPGGQKIGIYVCGPTVYDYFHIGNARIFIIFDLIRRYLRARGYDVTFVQNFTDIDDKMINRARELGITVDELARQYIRAYEEDARSLGVEKPDYAPRATEHMCQIIALIEKLVAQGAAYAVDGDVYFDTQAFPAYGRLSGQPLEELEAGARVEVDSRKRRPLDFALWKAQKEGEPAWDSPWGPGRPGWHIECSAMSMHYLGPTIDIHAGGPDLVFPHHENEIAQSEAATGQPFVRYWLHAGYLKINREKMSKSLGNFLTVRQLRQRYDAGALRLLMLSAHYRSPINFSEELLQQAASSLQRLSIFRQRLDETIAAAGARQRGEREKELEAALQGARESFYAAMDDDFNTAEALASIFSLVRELHTYIDQSAAPDRGILEECRRFVDETDAVLGILPAGTPDVLDSEIQALIDRREAARARRDYRTADELRAQLRERGIVLEDTPRGVRWRREQR